MNTNKIIVTDEMFDQEVTLDEVIEYAKGNIDTEFISELIENNAFTDEDWGRCQKEFDEVLRFTMSSIQDRMDNPEDYDDDIWFLDPDKYITKSAMYGFKGDEAQNIMILCAMTDVENQEKLEDLYDEMVSVAEYHGKDVPKRHF